MAKVLNYESQISQSLVIQSWHVSQSVDAFTGADAFDITLSGSSTITGSTNILASDASNLTLEVNESASFEFLTGAPNTGSFIVQTSPDTGKGALQSYFGQGTGTVFSATVPNQLFGLKYTTGSNASEGELAMTFGKRDLSGLGSPALNMNNFYVAYEPGGIFTNAQGELELHLGEHDQVGSGIVLQYRGGPSGTSQTSSYAGYFSSSAFPNQQLHTRPFAISATQTTVNDSNPAFVINTDITDLTTSNFSVDYGGNVVFNGNVSGSGANSSYTGDEYNAHGDDANSGFTLLSLTNKPILSAGNGKVNLGPPITTTIPTKLTSDNVEISGHVSGSGSACFQGGKPIVTHTTDLTNALANAGRYHIVGGNLTCSVEELPAVPTGAEFEFFQTSSTGQFLFETGSGTSILSKDGNLKLVGQGSAATLKKVAGATYHLVGDLTS